MIKKATSLRHPPPYQSQRNSWSNADPRTMPQQMSQQMPQQIPQQMPQQISQQMPQPTQQRMPQYEQMSQPMPQQTQQRMPQYEQMQQPGQFQSYSTQFEPGNRFSFAPSERNGFPLGADPLWRLGRPEFAYRTTDPQVRAQNLQVYRELIGITTPPGLDEGKKRVSTKWYLCYRRPTVNEGYYQRIVNEELKASIWYVWATWSINILLGLQIAIAATLTALGVSHTPGTGLAISVLAGINTAVATILTYLKAKGQPMRAMQYRDAMKELREKIEYTERLFELGITGVGTLNPALAAANIRSRYNAIQKQEERSEQAADAAEWSVQSAGAQAASPTDAKSSKKTTAPTSTDPTADTPTASSKVDHDAAARFA